MCTDTSTKQPRPGGLALSHSRRQERATGQVRFVYHALLGAKSQLARAAWLLVVCYIAPDGQAGSVTVMVTVTRLRQGQQLDLMGCCQA